MIQTLLLLALAGPPCPPAPAVDPPFQVTEDEERIRIAGTALEASIRKRSYVTGVEAQSLLDRKTGFREQGFGLDIVDWILEPGQSFSAAFIVGFFDSIEEMHQVYDRHAGHDRLEVTPRGWKLLRAGP